MLRLLRFTARKYADSFPTKGGPHPRDWSPTPGRSTLITSAPKSPSSIAQYGPARASVISTTRIPSRMFFTPHIIADRDGFPRTPSHAKHHQHGLAGFFPLRRPANSTFVLTLLGTER